MAHKQVKYFYAEGNPPMNTNESVLESKGMPGHAEQVKTGRSGAEAVGTMSSRPGGAEHVTQTRQSEEPTFARPGGAEKIS